MKNVYYFQKIEENNGRSLSSIAKSFIIFGEFEITPVISQENYKILFRGNKFVACIGTISKKISTILSPGRL